MMSCSLIQNILSVRCNTITLIFKNNNRKFYYFKLDMPMGKLPKKHLCINAVLGWSVFSVSCGVGPFSEYCIICRSARCAKKVIIDKKNIALKLFLNLKFNTLRYYLKIKIYFVSFFILNA